MLFVLFIGLVVPPPYIPWLTPGDLRRFLQAVLALQKPWRVNGRDPRERLPSVKNCSPPGSELSSG